MMLRFDKFYKQQSLKWRRKFNTKLYNHTLEYSDLNYKGQLHPLKDDRVLRLYIAIAQSITPNIPLNISQDPII